MFGVGNLKKRKLTVNRCYICKCELTKENFSKEHIIPNAIGGRLTSSNILCKICNNNFGKDIDNILTKQFKVLSNLLDIKRERGKNQDIKVYNDQNIEFKFPADISKSPKLSKPCHKYDEKTKKLDIYWDGENQKGYVYSILENYKYDEKIILEKLSNSLKKYDGELRTHFEIGNKNFQLAILKIILNYFIYCTGKIDIVKEKIEELNNKKIKDDEFYYVHGLNIFKLDKIKHKLSIKRDNKSKTLYGYIELFSIYRYLIVLNKNCEEEYNFNYSYDVINGLEIDEEIDLKEIKKYKELNLELYNKDFEKLYTYILENRKNRYEIIVCFRELKKILKNKDIEEKKVFEIAKKLKEMLNRNLEEVKKNNNINSVKDLKDLNWIKEYRKRKKKEVEKLHQLIRESLKIKINKNILKKMIARIDKLI